MAVRVDQARKDRSPLLIQDDGRPWPRFAWVDQPDNLPVVTYEDRAEMFEMACRIDLDAVDVIDQRIGG